MPGEVRECGGCRSGELTPLFDMGMQPLAEGRSDRRYPLKLLRCGNCSLVQLSYAAPQREVFPDDHPYSTGNSAALRQHYEDLTRAAAGNLRVGDLVIDIGANDGTLLHGYPDNLRKVAVEPTNQGARIGRSASWYPFYFTAELAHTILEAHGQAKVITACNVLAHVPDPHDFLDGVKELLHPDGVFITENHDLFSITDGLQIDTVYHEHLRYYSVASLSRLLEAHGLQVFSSVQIPTHGGSFQMTAIRARGNFTGRAKIAATSLRGLLWQLTFGGHQAVYGIGAATRATPLIHYAGIAEFLSFVCEVPGSDKIGTLMPGTNVKVVDEAQLIEDQPAYALLFSWHMKDVIVPKLRAAGYQGKFVVPLPKPKVIDD